MKTVDHFNWDRYDVPPHTKEALANYFVHGWEPGSFLTSVLCNDLVGACSRADHVNRNSIHGIVMWLVNEAPYGSWGDRDAYTSWIKKGPYREAFEKNLVVKVLSTDYE